MSPITVRPLDEASAAEISLVASRMRETLSEVLGEARGGAMYTPSWLEERVRFHLGRDSAAVFVALDGDAIVGHEIVRIDEDDPSGGSGLFSTTYVLPAFRRRGVATLLLLRGEAWMRERSLARALTYTDRNNTKLIGHYRKHGYDLTPMDRDMVMLDKRLGQPWP